MFIIKVSLQEETRRVAVESAPTEFVTLQAMIRNLFGSQLQDSPFAVLYTDEDNDKIIISSSLELEEAVRLAKSMATPAVLKLTVAPASGVPKTASQPSTASNMVASFVPLDLEDSMPEPAVVAVLEPQVAVQVAASPVPETAQVVATSPVAPAPAVSTTVSQVRSSVIISAKDIDVLEIIEKQLQLAFGAVKTFLQTLELDSAVLSAVHSAQTALQSASVAVEKEVITPLTALTKARAVDFTQELAKLQAEIARIKTQVTSELAKAADSIAALAKSGSEPVPPVVECEMTAMSPAPQAPATEDLAPNAAQDDLKKLQDMGFADKSRNITLLAKHNGNLMSVVEELLQPQ